MNGVMILVSGASGYVCGELVRRLAAKSIPVRALVRSPERAGGLAGLPGVEIAVGDMQQPETLREAFRGVDRAMLISSSVAAMADVQNSFIETAARSGVKHMVKLSGSISDLASPFRFARMHAASEAHLERSGMTWTHLRAGEFMHSYFRQVPAIVNRGILPLPMGGARIASIDIGDIAEVAAVVLTDDRHNGQAYLITGPDSLTMAEIADRLSRVTGKTIRYVDADPEAVKEAQRAAGVPPYAIEALGELFAERRKGKEAVLSTVIPDVFGWQPTSFEAFATRHAAIFRGEQPPPKV